MHANGANARTREGWEARSYRCYIPNCRTLDLAPCPAASRRVRRTCACVQFSICPLKTLKPYTPTRLVQWRHGAEGALVGQVQRAWEHKERGRMAGAWRACVPAVAGQARRLHQQGHIHPAGSTPGPAWLPPCDTRERATGSAPRALREQEANNVERDGVGKAPEPSCVFINSLPAQSKDVRRAHCTAARCHSPPNAPHMI
jgi:hypothetical protein